ncbi:MAG: hypothetical protein AW07_01529 [Candidatus Accumulibacter sp. SK-11]|nr:MAG: hypothetical protein AW07_01529 [Candidatus Accumulibacter sp. SK-11]HRL76150.1 hypothetical protein [Candidatus Accumulibacter phosphatis]
MNPPPTTPKASFMSLIHTVEPHHIEPFHYLAAVALAPSDWVPWNHTEARARAEAGTDSAAQAQPG